MSSARNKTITVQEGDKDAYLSKCYVPTDNNLILDDILGKTIFADFFSLSFPKEIADLIIIDPPYNIPKSFSEGNKFSKMSSSSYEDYVEKFVTKCFDILKPNGSMYVCCDWTSSPIIHSVLSRHLHVINRITWKRDKGRGAKKNWKNNLEDIFYCVKDKNDYYFDLESVKVKKKVIAPYRENGKPKDWCEDENGRYRMTCPSNFWEDIVIPFWSMPENTDHPTQKPEKLISRLIKASCPIEGLVFDPFLGSGTTSVCAKKMNRHYVGVEHDEKYCIIAEKRIENDL